MTDGHAPRRHQGDGGRAAAFQPQEGEGDGSQHDVGLPPAIAPAFEVIESRGILEFAILLFDRPVEIPTGGLALGLATETRAESIQVEAQAAQQRAGGIRRHARDGTESRRPVQAKSALSGGYAQPNLTK